MNLKEHVPFGRTGLMVSRIGLASGYGVPTAAIEKAFHEYGINYFYVSFLFRRNIMRAIHNLAPRHRDDLRIVLAWPAFASRFLQSYVERWLRKLKIDQADLLVLQDLRKAPNQKLVDRMHWLTDSGKVRYIGISSHDRPFLGSIARGEKEVPADFFQIRYNAVHTGAEQDIFPHLPKENRLGIVIFTATCWGRLLKPRLLPEGERPLAPVDCYRFVLSHPDVNVCVTAPSNEWQMEHNLKALDLGPLNEEEMARIRRIGKNIYRKKNTPPHMAR